MSTTIKIEGLKKLKAKLNGKSLAVEIARGVVDATNFLHQKIVLDIQRGSRTGRIYKRKNRKHQASAPFEPPKTDTGTLIRGIKPRITRSGMTGEVLSTARYAKDLEYGTRRMKPRPYLRSNLRRYKREIVAKIERRVKAFI